MAPELTVSRLILPLPVNGDPSPAAVVKETRHGSNSDITGLEQERSTEHHILGSIAAPMISVYRTEVVFKSN